MKVTDNVSNIKKTFKFFDDNATNGKHKYPTVGRRLVRDRVQRRWLSYDLTP
jgi:hypothetical protein